MSSDRVPAGWYDDPDMVGTRRYWDGTSWTEHVAEAPPDTEPRDRRLLGYGIVFGLLLPAIGFIIGLGLLFSRPGYGIRAILASIVGMVLWMLILTSQYT